MAFEIQASDVVIPERCPIFGCPIEAGFGKRGPRSPSLDRIDPSKGYVRGNVWVVSYRANAVKNDGTPDEHEQIARVVRERLALEESA